MYTKRKFIMKIKKLNSIMMVGIGLTLSFPIASFAQTKDLLSNVCFTSTPIHMSASGTVSGCIQASTPCHTATLKVDGFEKSVPPGIIMNISTQPSSQNCMQAIANVPFEAKIKDTQGADRLILVSKDQTVRVKRSSSCTKPTAETCPKPGTVDR
jgi:hypothetical protein